MRQPEGRATVRSPTGQCAYVNPDVISSIIRVRLLTRASFFSYNTTWLCNYMVMQSVTSHLNATGAARYPGPLVVGPSRGERARGTVCYDPTLFPEIATPNGVRAGSSPSGWRQASAWLDQYRKFWQASFARLDTVLEELKHKKPRRGKPSR